MFIILRVGSGDDINGVDDTEFILIALAGTVVSSVITLLLFHILALQSSIPLLQ